MCCLNLFKVCCFNTMKKNNQIIADKLPNKETRFNEFVHDKTLTLYCLHDKAISNIYIQWTSYFCNGKARPACALNWPSGFNIILQLLKFCFKLSPLYGFPWINNLVIQIFKRPRYRLAHVCRRTEIVDYIT